MKGGRMVRLWHPSGVLSQNLGYPGVSLRSTPGYASLNPPGSGKENGGGFGRMERLGPPGSATRGYMNAVGRAQRHQNDEMES
jgi:hypothetical protein